MLELVQLHGGREDPDVIGAADQVRSVDVVRLETSSCGDEDVSVSCDWRKSRSSDL